MTIKQIVTVMGGLVIGAVVTLMVLVAFHIPLAAYGPVNLTLTVVLFGLAGMIGLDSLLKAGFLTK